MSTFNNQYALDGGVHGGQGSKAGGLGYTEEISPSLKAVPSGGNTVPDVLHSTTAYGISAYESNAMKSGNPHSGIYQADTARTLDLNGGSPACNQGGVAIVHAVDCRNGTEDEINATLQGGQTTT